MSFHPPLLASGGAGALLWLIIIVFWAFSTLAQKSREKKEAERRRAMRPAGPSGAPPPPPPPPSPKREAVDPEEELRRFLRELTGMPPAPPKPQPLAPPPLPPAQARPRAAYVNKSKAATSQPPAIQFDEPPPPSRAPVAPGGGAYANKTQEIGSANDAHIYEMLGEIEDIEVLMSRQAASLYSGETMVRQDSMLVNLSKIRVPLMTLPFISYKSVRHAVNRPQLTGNRDALHQALIARVVLGPCKAFDAAPGKDGLANQ